MFVKFVRYPESESESVSEQMIECLEFTQCYTEKNGGAYFMTYGKGLESQTINIICERTAVYVMSESGKTIDSYKWRNIDGVIKRV